MEVPGSPFGTGSSSPGTLAAKSRGYCRHTGSGGGRLRADGDMALQDMEGVLHNSMVLGAGTSDRRKRLRMDADQENEMEQLKHLLAVRGRNFVPILASQTTFQTEAVKQKTETLYSPLTSDVLVNVRTAEQVSYDAGVYFIADHKGSYQRNSQGHVINFWRYSESAQRLYIARSFLFTNVMDFVHIKEILENI